MSVSRFITMASIAAERGLDPKDMLCTSRSSILVAAEKL